MVFSGSFFALQLLLAVLEENFIKSAFPRSRLKVIQEKMLEERERNLQRAAIEKNNTLFPFIYASMYNFFEYISSKTKTFFSGLYQMLRICCNSCNRVSTTRQDVEMPGKA